MEQRTFLKSVATMGALLTIIGCMGGDSESRSTMGTKASNEAGNSMTGETTIEVELAEVPSPELIPCTNSGVLRVVHMGGEKITDGGTGKVYVIIGDEHVMAWVADGGKGGELPVLIGNLLEIEPTESGSTIEVVQVGSEGAEEVLTTHEVGARETVTTTIMNETAMNETTANETATNETITAIVIETATPSGNETSN